MVGRSQMVALLKQVCLPFVLVDNAATSSLIHQYSESYRSWFSDIFLIRSGRVWDGLVVDTSSTEYAFCRLFSSEGGVCDGLDGVVVSTDTTKPVDIRVAITTTATTPAASTPATIPAASTSATTPAASTSATIPVASTPATIPAASTPATIPAASTHATIPAASTPAPSPSTPNLHPTQCSFSTTQTLHFFSPVC